MTTQSNLVIIEPGWFGSGTMRNGSRAHCMRSPFDIGIAFDVVRTEINGNPEMVQVFFGCGCQDKNHVGIEGHYTVWSCGIYTEAKVTAAIKRHRAWEEKLDDAALPDWAERELRGRQYHGLPTEVMALAKDLGWI